MVEAGDARSRRCGRRWRRPEQGGGARGRPEQWRRGAQWAAGEMARAVEAAGAGARDGRPEQGRAVGGRGDGACGGGGWSNGGGAHAGDRSDGGCAVGAAAAGARDGDGWSRGTRWRAAGVGLTGGGEASARGETEEERRRRWDLRFFGDDPLFKPLEIDL